MLKKVVILAKTDFDFNYRTNHMEKFIFAYTFIGLIIGCTPAENAKQVDPPSPTDKDNKTVEVQPSSENGKEEKVVTVMMYMEKRDSEGNIVGMLDEGLWFKQGDEAPYTGLVVGMNKPKDGEPPAFPYNYKREYQDGVQTGVETGWYTTGKKRIELIYKNGEVVSMRQWDADGKELKKD